jgi:hypothetical protein
MTLTVMLRCPACGHEWHAATIAAWDKGATPLAIARQCHCVSCQQRPPMIYLGQQGTLFPEDAR